MSTIQSLLESANPYKSVQADAKRLSTKWAKTGLLEGLSEQDSNNMSIILENQAKQLVVESSATGAGTSAGTFTVGQSENWAGIALPLVRKVFGSIAAKEFVSVQPMNMPSGLVFFLDFQYGNTKNPFTSGNSLYGNRNTTSRTPFSTIDATGGLYGAGRWSYTSNQFSSSLTLATATVVTSASFSDVGFDANYSASLGRAELKKFTIVNFTNSGSADLEGVRSMLLLSGSTIVVSDNFNQFNSVNAAGTTFTFIISASTGELGASQPYDLYYNKQTADNNRGDFEDNTSSTSFSVPNSLSATAISIPEINVQMQSQAIIAKTKKIKAAWTPEFAQDLNAYQNVDAEAELTNMMSDYVSMEIDLEILDMLIQDAAAGTEYWSAANNQVINSTGTAFAAASSAYYNTQGGWFQTLGTKVQKLSNKIHQLTLRGGANFMVVSPTVATILEAIPGFSANNNGDVAQMEYAFGVQKAGSLNGRYTVYKNPYMTENTILLGFRGKQFLEAGAVFAPYIPLIMTPLVMDPNTFTPRKGLMTRYAKKMLRPEFYAKIFVDSLNTI